MRAFFKAIFFRLTHFIVLLNLSIFLSRWTEAWAIDFLLQFFTHLIVYARSDNIYGYHKCLWTIEVSAHENHFKSEILLWYVVTGWTLSFEDALIIWICRYKKLRICFHKSKTLVRVAKKKLTLMPVRGRYCWRVLCFQPQSKIC